MKRSSVFTVIVFGFLTALSCFAQRQQESWTGGFSVNGNWVAVLISFNQKDYELSGTASVILPFWGNRENANNVPLENLTRAGNRLHFQIPVGSRKIVFDGRRTADTISGNYIYDKSSGTFGLTQRATAATVPPEKVEKYYGAYRVSPDRVISILRGWSYGRTLNYVDYKTGRVGTLWPKSETEFFAGDGLAVSFPVTITVSFKLNPSGNVKGLIWQTKDERRLAAKKIQFKEERITFPNGDIKLGGTLILPSAKGPHAVVIVTPGDYGTNRDQLRMWAHNFTSRGVAALIFDSRGGGESTGPVNSSSFSDLANDVLAAVQALKKRADVNPRKIGLFGFSNSTFTVTLAASRSHDVSFLILQSLVGVPGWKQETFRAETQLRVDGFPERDVNKGVDFMRLKYEVARTGNGWDRLQNIIQQAGSERWIDYTAAPNSLDRLRQTYDLIMEYDPAPALEKLNIPILAVWGDKDTFVPVTESVAVFKRAMAKAGSKNYVIKIYPNGSHSLLETATGSPSTGGKETNFSPGLWKFEIDWIRKHVGRN